ncbi:DUF5819 family protein [Streptomyces sp. NPDC006512]|uniref:DUF5819 family protein n=1 Tax=Streptomyces sp. NPDC006512 TaxID=3154307 RepID=UPI0033A584F7
MSNSVPENSSDIPLSSLSAGRRASVIAASVIAAGALAFHFGMTALYNTPFNPIREKYDEQIHSYMSPYFGQDWHLFAPNPISEDSGLLIRAKIPGPDGAQVTTQWSDVTTPHIDKLHDQRFWPSRVERLPTAVRQQLDGWRDPQLEKLRAENQPVQPTGGAATAATDPTEPAGELKPALTQAELDGRDSAMRYAQALASAEARRLWGADVEAVQVRVVSNEYPRFSERYTRESKGKVDYYDLDWAKPLKVTR